MARDSWVQDVLFSQSPELLKELFKGLGDLCIKGLRSQDHPPGCPRLLGKLGWDTQVFGFHVTGDAASGGDAYISHL